MVGRRAEALGFEFLEEDQAYLQGQMTFMNRQVTADATWDEDNDSQESVDEDLGDYSLQMRM